MRLVHVPSRPIETASSARTTVARAATWDADGGDFLPGSTGFLAYLNADACHHSRLWARMAFSALQAVGIALFVYLYLG